MGGLLLYKGEHLPISMDVLHSQFIQPDVDIGDNTIRGYRYNSGSSSTYFQPEQIIKIANYNINDDFNSYSPLESVYT